MHMFSHVPFYSVLDNSVVWEHFYPVFLLLLLLFFFISNNVSSCIFPPDLLIVSGWHKRTSVNVLRIVNPCCHALSG